MANFEHSAEKKMPILWYAQKPVCHTKIQKLVKYDEYPGGQNVIVGVACRGGGNIEDSYILNAASVQRGLFTSMMRIVYSRELSRKEDGEVHFGHPMNIHWFTDDVKAIADFKKKLTPEKLAALAKLDPNDGIISPGEKVAKDDALFCIIHVRNVDDKDGKRVGKSLSYEVGRYKEPLPGSVRTVWAGVNGKDYTFVEVVVCAKMDAIVGNKYASGHGQKGVCGKIVPEEDMIFTAEGIRPDVLINPTAFPSRMTIGQFIESISGKAYCLSKNGITRTSRGSRGDVMDMTLKELCGQTKPKRDSDDFYSCESDWVDMTAFSQKKRNFAAIAKRLTENGYKASGSEQFMEGTTGEIVPCLIFVGVVFMGPINHLVPWKTHTCVWAPRGAIDRQPIKGRGAGGGLRFGRMEIGATMANGCAAFLQDRTKDQSDATTMWVCNKCGIPANVGKAEFKKECPICQGSECTNISTTTAAKNLSQELAAMGIGLRIVPEDRGAPIRVLEPGNVHAPSKKTKKG